MKKGRKQTGSYYTPDVLANFLVNHLFDKYLSENDQLRILEPSCGDGEFLKPLSSHLGNRNVCLDLVELDNEELAKAAKQIQIDSTNLHCTDFLKFGLSDRESYSLIIGNPPYISKKHLSEEQIEICKKVCQPHISGEVKNIWPTFLVKSIEFLEENGIVCFVLPSELLQVKYTSGLRRLILDSFERVEVFAFNELIFEKAEQDVVAIIGIKNHQNDAEHGVSFYQVDKLEDLKIPNYTERNFNVHRERLDKWTNYILSDEELNGIDEITNELQLRPIENYCEKAEVGIVTAANQYFIKSASQLKDYNLERYLRPILQKSNVLQNTVTITQELFDNLRANDKTVNLICFRNESRKRHSLSAQKYILKGEDEKLHKRYKMTKRVHWYHVPSIWSSEAIFSKRSHEYPRIFLNEADVLVTDSFYRIVSKEGIDIKKLVFSFYNSLTLTLAELEGRFYGGGVLELIPSEFKDLLIPYTENVTNEHFDHLESLFNEGAELNRILNFTDPILMPQLDDQRIQSLRTIRLNLFNRRTKVQNKDQSEVLEPVEHI